MRLFLAGLLLLILPTGLFAQATGQVISIGYNGSYRPNCWTPMLVRLVPETTDAVNYQIQVFQHDLDGDKPVYVRNIVLNGSGQAPDQMFWTYFLPQPIDGGLTDGNLRELQKDLQVSLFSADGKRSICKLPLTSTLQNVDPHVDASNKKRSAKLILSVSANGANQPQLGQYNDQVGALEDVQVVNLRPRDLPEDPIGYEAVDAIVWLDGNPDVLSSGNQDTLAAVKDYVRFGGRLVICQSTSNWEEDKNFGDMLPVDPIQVDTKSNFEPLKSMAAVKENDPFDIMDQSWGRSTGPYAMVRATARPGTVVNTWIDWKQDGSNTDATPYLARKAYGLGQVVWVAQPLTVDAAPSNPMGWPHVWDQVFGWKSVAYSVPNTAAELDERRTIYQPAGPIDLGFKFVQGLNLDSKSAWLIFLAVIFFLVYWLIAGPGTYAYLATKKKQGLSWFLFGVSALVATGVTMLVVKVVLRGPPQIKHVSFVRCDPSQPAIIYSRFGLYIPRDGDQKIELKDTSPTSVSYVAPFAEHPQQLGSVTEFPAPADYFVPVRDLKSDTPPSITVPYRSSLKKFQARWVGDSTMKFIGSPKLDTDRIPITGSLTNATGQNLSDVYLAFKLDNNRDWMIYIPTWAAGATYDLKKDLGKPLFIGKSDSPLMAFPGQGKIISDQITSTDVHSGWKNYWFDHFRRSSEEGDPDKEEDDYNFVFPMLSVFTRLPAMADSKETSKIIGQLSYTANRVELYSRGARMLDASPSITAGQLVILGSNKGPLPMPVEVDGDKIAGDGVTFYQFTLPINRAPDAPTTEPAKK